jgi:hypothetical protein
MHQACLGERLKCMLIRVAALPPDTSLTRDLRSRSPRPWPNERRVSTMIQIGSSVLEVLHVVTGTLLTGGSCLVQPSADQTWADTKIP